MSRAPVLNAWPEKSPLARRRFYRSPVPLLRDVARVAGQGARAARIVTGKTVSPAFRERLMLAVTSVNQCRYCAFVHTGLGGRAGLGDAEMNDLLHGLVPDCPDEERAAIHYAIEWAQSGGRMDWRRRQELVGFYGASGAADIELVLRMIWIGNLFGNTVDTVLARLGLLRG